MPRLLAMLTGIEHLDGASFNLLFCHPRVMQGNDLSTSWVPMRENRIKVVNRLLKIHRNFVAANLRISSLGTLTMS
jgi:hypothetical protein